MDNPCHEMTLPERTKCDCTDGAPCGRCLWTFPKRCEHGVRWWPGKKPGVNGFCAECNGSICVRDGKPYLANDACRDGHCLFCTKDAPGVYFCGYCLLPNCGFAECRDASTKNQ